MPLTRLFSYFALAGLFSYLSFGEFTFFTKSNNTHFVADEICDNGIDDDLDGLVDLNDPDCDCPVAVPTSLIPNPSFEEMNCCPIDRSQLGCAVDWIQASEATTDYLHTCGWMGWDNLPPPLPFPDGNGCVGWRNGRPAGANGEGPIPNWKEYAGACLTGPLKAGTSYRFEFYVGFTTQPNSPSTNIVFYGTSDCANLPFGIGNEAFGCPTNGPGWRQLGAVSISGTFEWQKKEINVTPSVDIHAIAIGPDCSTSTTTFQPYYFFDNLVLASQEAFGFRISTSTHPCSDDLALQVIDLDTLEYQWYKEGVALLGETGPSLQNPPGEGQYQVRLLGPNSCLITEVFNFNIPTISSFAKATICQGESFSFNQQQLTESGLYLDTIKSVNNCDSIIYLELEELAEMRDTLQAIVFEGESFAISGERFSDEGEHLLNLTSVGGCDSIVHVFLDFYKIFIPNSFSPNFDGFNDVFTAFGGPDVKALKSMEIFNRWGGLVFSGFNLLPSDLSNGWDGSVDGKPADTGTYVYKIVVALEDEREKEFLGSVVLIR